MTEDEFWEHIRATRRVDPDAHAERLIRRLAKLPTVEILDFAQLWDAAYARASGRDLLGAAYLIKGECSDLSFMGFRNWLILRGQAVYEAAIVDPDSLAEVLRGGDKAWVACYPGLDAWLAATGTEDNIDGSAAFKRALKALHPRRPKLPPLAKGWDFDNADEVRRRFPRLAVMYLGDDDEG